MTSGNLRDITARLVAQRNTPRSAATSTDQAPDAESEPPPAPTVLPLPGHHRPGREQAEWEQAEWEQGDQGQASGQPQRAPRRVRPSAEEAAQGAALAELARGVLADAVRIAGWAGPDCPVGASGQLSTQHLREATRQLDESAEKVANAWRRALLAGLVEIRDERANPGWRYHAWVRDDAAVLRGWRSLFDGWSRLLPPPGCPDELIAAVTEHTAQVLAVLHLSEDPVPLSVLRRLLIDEEEAAFLFGESETRRFGPSPSSGDDGSPDVDAAPASDDPLDVALDWMLDALAEAHAVAREQGNGVRTATLTPLGNWAVRGRIDEICAVAQGSGGHTERDAAGLLRACAGGSPAQARSEYRAWAGARPVYQAVTELLDVARGEDALLRGMAFEALRAVGTPAEAKVREATEDPVLRPYALLWLAERDGEEAPASLLSRGEAAWLWVDTAAAVVDHGAQELLVQHLESGTPGGPDQLLTELRAVSHPRMVDVLCAAASVHPDQRLGRALRRIAFRAHPGGALG